MTTTENVALTVRPKRAAEMLGIGLSTFWDRVRTDSDFPELIKLSPKICVMRVADLEGYVTRKSARGRK